MHYIFLIYNCEDRPKPGEPGFEEILTRVNAFADECRRRGAFVAGDPLKPVTTATTVRVREGRAMLTDGPFAETHEHLGGYYLLDCRDLDEALELAEMMPQAQFGATVEVRPVERIPGLNHGVA
ncbi:YciI family protein [Lentzea sp. DG1S-22]|uniref:YciI family protein n=1 Tax=Lentzea sp. DG1S-22 TaxID=3108822 RepID=UPI002E76BF2B|nr:YciI family protein [Lentzea sp. DG1S-22]WVH81516.1 YciI family protein [Lentzea sp. DG1S-22]